MSELAAAPARKVAAPQAGSRGELRLHRKCACGQHSHGGHECNECTQKRLKLQRWSADRPAPGALIDVPTSTHPIAAGARGAGLDLSHVQARTPSRHKPAGPDAVAREGIQAHLAAREPEATSMADVPGAPAPPASPSPAAGASDSHGRAAAAAPQDPASSPFAARSAAAASPEALRGAATTERSADSPLIVDDHADELHSGQLRKSDFLDRLQALVYAEADAALAGSGHSTDSCPYLSYWFGFYRGQSADHIQRTLHRYVPAARAAHAASDYIPLVASRVRRAVDHWLRTGEVSGVPAGAPRQAGEHAAAAQTPRKAPSPVQLKARDGDGSPSDDPAAVQSQLGAGRPLEAGVRSRMERAFGRSFAHVRAHTDATAGRLSREQEARAFTVGRHVAFASGEYRPGTMIGDALIAHELAHVVQQTGAIASGRSLARAEYAQNALEADADAAAIGAVSSLWTRAGRLLTAVSENALPRLKSGLRLSRCPGKPKTGVQRPSSARTCVTLESMEAKKTGRPTMTTAWSGGQCQLSFGEPNASGMTVESVVDIPSGCTGSLEYVQLIDTCRQLRIGTKDYRRKSAGFALDTRDPWRAVKVDSPGNVTFYAADSPGQPVVEQLTFVAADDRFKTWLLWRPSGVTSRTPLAMAEWYWKAKATRIGSSGNCAADWQVSEASAGGGRGVRTSEMPTWSENSADLNKSAEPGTCG